MRALRNVADAIGLEGAFLVAAVVGFAVIAAELSGLLGALAVVAAAAAVVGIFLAGPEKAP